MSDGYSDVIAHYRRVLDECIKFMVRYHISIADDKLKVALITEDECREFHRLICTIPRGFWSDELKLPKYLRERFDKWSSASRMPHLEELFFLLCWTGKFTQLVELQLATEYRDKLILLIDDTGRTMYNGVHFQDKFWRFMDGDQDILIGLAKKRCYKQPFVGKCPVLIAGIKYRYRKQGFTLKDVVDIHGNQLGRDNHGTSV